MKEAEMDFGSALTGFICGGIFGIMFMFMVLVFNDFCTPNYFHKQAVSHKAGVWIVDKEGKVEFKWNDQLPSTKEEK